MLLLHRGCTVPSLSARLMDHHALTEHVRVVICSRRGVMVDDELFRSSFPRRLSEQRNNLLMALAGSVHVRLGGRVHSLSAGEFLIARRDSDWATRIERDADFMILEWDAERFGRVAPSTGGRLCAADHSRLAAAISPWTRQGARSEVALRSLAGCVELLRGAGAPIPLGLEHDLHSPVAPAFANIARALDQLIANLACAPGSAELEGSLGRSARQVSRQIAAFHDRFGFNAQGGVRDLLQRWRVYAGASLMTANGTTTEAVAALLGYGSPSAFCKAFAAHGLLSPGAVAKAVRELA